MKNNNYDILGNVANYLNEMAMVHRIISASTASAFCYMLREEISIEKLRTLISLILKIKEEDELISKTLFYEEIKKIDVVNIELILESLVKAIEEPIDLKNIKVIVPTPKEFVQIGRSARPEHGNDIIFKTDKTLSRVHLLVTAEEGKLYIEDRSANGTFINGSKIEKGVQFLVQTSDKIRIGREKTLVNLSDPKIIKLIS